MVNSLINRLNQLDSTLAEAIQQVIAGGFETAEVNPIQMLLFDLIKDNFGKKTPDLELLKDKNGKFISKNS